MQYVFQKIREPVGSNAVGNNRASRTVRCKNCRNKRNYGIAVYFLAVGKNGAHTVNVSVKNQSEVCIVAYRSILNCLHCGLVFRVRYVIRKHSVRFKELTS